MNIRQILRILAFLCLVLCVFLLLPAGFALAYREERALAALLRSILLVAPAACLGLWLTRNTRVRELSTSEGFLLVSLAWLVAAFFGALPFLLSGAIPGLTDAFFESMSGFSTTGATILTDIERLPRSLLFWRSFTQWLGGMGIIVLTVAIFPLLGIGGLQLMRAEAPGPSVDRLTPKIAATAKLLWLVYLGLTAGQTLLLMGGGLSLFEALTHAFTTTASGGFSTRNASVGAFGSVYVDVVVTVFMVLAGANFALLFKAFTGRFREIGRNSELKVYLGIFAVSSLVIAASLHGRVFASFAESLRFAGFQAISILTTTGFVTADYTTWPPLAQAVLFTFAFIGGSSGSTSGGIKVMRILILVQMGLVQMRRLLHPRGVFTLKVNRETVRPELLADTGGFFFLYIAIILAVTLAITAAGYDIFSALSSALVALGNIGPGFGLVGPARNFAHFPQHVKWILSLAMMVGRLEIYTVLILLTPGFWQK